MSQENIGAAYLADVMRNFRSYKKLAEEVLAQTGDDDICRLIDQDANSIAILVKHMAGNMRSRWTNFLTNDGEKPGRHRDREFEVDPGTTRVNVMKWGEEGWRCVFDAVDPLKSQDLCRQSSLPPGAFPVIQAITCQLLHYAGHVNQIVLLVKHFRWPDWKSLSIPKGQSETYARQFEQKHAARAETT